jgi:hypothetical protein
MFVLAPFSYVLTHVSLALDTLVKNDASKRHAIGWCVLARKS